MDIADKTRPRVRQDSAASEQSTDERSIAKQRACGSRGKLPAFGKKWLAARLAGNAPTGALLITRSWPKTRDQRWTLVVPAEDDPADYDMSMIAGLGVIVSVGSKDTGNAVLIAKIEEAGPAVAAVLVDGAFHCWVP